MDIEALKEQYVGYEFDSKEFEVDADAIIDFAAACGETASRYVDKNDPEFQAPPTFVSSLMSNRQMPEDFPKFDGVSMNAGKSMTCINPIRPGTIQGRSRIHEIYTKTGRSGRMVFVVSRMEFFDASETLLAQSDSRQVIRERAK